MKDNWNKVLEELMYNWLKTKCKKVEVKIKWN